MNFCDLKCRYAAFPREGAIDGAGSCRTFAALYCEKRKTYVHKNMPCDEKEEGRNRKKGRQARRPSGSQGGAVEKPGKTGGGAR